MQFGFGPMSPEIIEAVYQYSQNYNTDLMLIASKNQVDWDEGYVATTADYYDMLANFQRQYPDSNVMICRDHCGPGFKNAYYDDEFDIEQTIRSDIALKFDLIHIDMCHYNGDIIKKTCEMIEYARSLNPDIQIEIGTDDIEAKFVDNDLVKFEAYIRPFVDFKPLYYVVNTGSLIKENKQVGRFNQKMTGGFARILNKYNIKLKEHNADYLSGFEIGLRQWGVDAMNIAPQLGVVQTTTVLSEAQKYGINIDDFVNLVYNKGRWRKWDYGNLDGNPYLATIVGGHYHYKSNEWKRLIYCVQIDPGSLQTRVISEITDVIHHYVTIGT